MFSMFANPSRVAAARIECSASTFAPSRAVQIANTNGNPVSSFVCALLFVKPAIAAMLGVKAEDPTMAATAGADLKANDGRQDYIRARIVRRDGAQWAEPFPVQDSSMQRVLAEADALIVRPPHAPAVERGSHVPILPLE